jgi:hypothetical protein
MERPHNPELLRSKLFDRCERLWGAGLTVKLLVFVAGAAVVLYPSNAKSIGVATLVLGLISEGLLWRSDTWKSAAQGLHRKLDFENAFGWSVTAGEIADLLARYPGTLDGLSGEPKGSYFASKEPPGAKRALQNVCESSWWSMHLAESMAWAFTTLIIVIIVGCIILLNVSIESLPPTVSLASTTQAVQGMQKAVDVVNASVVKIVTSSFLFIVSYGLLRFATGYFSFSNKSKEVREKAETLLEGNYYDQLSAIKLWQDYHLARAAAPLLPGWIWRIREKKLNVLFAAYLQEIN